MISFRDGTARDPRRPRSATASAPMIPWLAAARRASGPNEWDTLGGRGARPATYGRNPARRPVRSGRARADRADARHLSPTCGEAAALRGLPNLGICSPARKHDPKGICCKLRESVPPVDAFGD